jgi:hypothetical protein
VNKPDDAPKCGHWRHWNQEHGECLGHYDWETCDECGRKVCFDIDCENGWRWDEDMAVICFLHEDKKPSKDGLHCPDWPDNGEALQGCGGTNIEWDGEVWGCLDCGLFFTTEAGVHVLPA